MEDIPDESGKLYDNLNIEYVTDYSEESPDYLMSDSKVDTVDTNPKERNAKTQYLNVSHKQTHKFVVNSGANIHICNNK